MPDLAIVIVRCRHIREEQYIKRLYRAANPPDAFRGSLKKTVSFELLQLILKAFPIK
jgi:hypothetical protein